MQLETDLLAGALDDEKYTPCTLLQVSRRRKHSECPEKDKASRSKLGLDHSPDTTCALGDLNWSVSLESLSTCASPADKPHDDDEDEEEDDSAACRQFSSSMLQEGSCDEGKAGSGCLRRIPKFHDFNELCCLHDLGSIQVPGHTLGFRRIARCHDFSEFSV
eukprot:TRINITY_DN4886_c0_g1_i1.p1 TRINITY_DN4886_c0_g1~~TRINITY_DN4886_c0_g1_i1.p1  ORF type:complete len:162 (-),score=38.86 TRINITY_DN4886_c0_g1_i1:68-553(-)